MIADLDELGTTKQSIPLLMVVKPGHYRITCIPRIEDGVNHSVKTRELITLNDVLCLVEQQRITDAPSRYKVHSSLRFCRVDYPLCSSTP
jgi:hypothetical protein